MKRFLLLLCIGMSAGSAFAMDWPQACGADATQYKVKANKNAGVPSSPTGMAQLVFIESLDGDFLPAPTVRFAVDGVWVGANHGHSYFIVPVTPGVHKLCASRQSSAKVEKSNLSTVTVTAAAGTTYYYQFTIQRPLGNAKMEADGGTPGSKGAGMGMDHAELPDVVTLSPLEGKDASMAMRRADLSVSVAK